jgi:hypothetical protein
MPYHLELGSDGSSFGGKAIVVNTQTGKHYSAEPISLDKAKAQMRVLQMSEHEASDEPKKEIVADKKEVADYMKGSRRVAIMEYKHSKPDPNPDRSDEVGPAEKMRERILGLSLFPNIFNKKFLTKEMA